MTEEGQGVAFEMQTKTREVGTKKAYHHQRGRRDCLGVTLDHLRHCGPEVLFDQEGQGDAFGPSLPSTKGL